MGDGNLGWKIRIRKDGIPVVTSPRGEYRVDPKRQYRGFTGQRTKDAMKDINDQLLGTGKKIQFDGKRVSVRDDD